MMKKNFNIPALLTVAAVIGTAVVSAMPGFSSGSSEGAPDDRDTAIVMRYLPGEIRDTAQFNAEAEAKSRRQTDPRANINVLTRAYGDSVVLRWAADDYVAWRYLCRVGVNIVRMDEKTLDEDTLVMEFRPATLDEFRSRYSEDDSVAGMAMGALYNIDRMSPNETQDEAGSMGSLYEISQEQQLQYGIAVLASEWRQDLADRLAMRFVDRTAKKGHYYSYMIRPAVYDTTNHVAIRVGVADSVANVRFKPEAFDVQLSDSINYPNGIFISWEDRLFSSYEVERRLKGTAKWERLNERPYIIMNGITGGDCFYSDHVDKPGTYEYRVLAHDPFGELTEPSPVHEVTIRDMEPPTPPRLTWIEIDRRNEEDPSKEVFATIHFVKDTMEADYVGCVPMYFHERITGGKWRPLVDKPLAPTDTMVTVDVTNLVTGQLVVAAYDTAHNVSYSIPQLLRVSDMKAPDAPQGFKAETSLVKVDSLDMPLGLITLTWHPLANDDIDYYEVVFANDSTHEFMTQKHGIVNDTVFVDTVAVDVNQKYIYYKVRAVDYSTNVGEFSPMLQVIRPSAVPPTVAHLDSSYVDGKGIFMRWIVGSDQQMAYHHVYRRLIDSDKEWTLLRRCDADSVKACNDYIDLTDVPKPNPDEEYVYAVESFNFSGISSGLSLQYCTRFTGETVFRQDIRLFASYEEDKHVTRLAWEASNLPEGKDWYFCVWRQGPDDDRFKFLMSAEAGDRDFTDYLLNAGETAHYFIQIQMEDGRESEPSNIVTIKAPEKKE
jgi:hypothetical protein